jgi:hypothetical protein
MVQIEMNRKRAKEQDRKLHDQVKRQRMHIPAFGEEKRMVKKPSITHSAKAKTDQPLN